MPMTRATTSGALVSLDGVSGSALKTAARALKTDGYRGAGISEWDASGIFGELAAAERGAGAPSPRVLLLLYAADLAFRLRWEIHPALAKGRIVIAAPYIETAVAFGRAAGLAGRLGQQSVRLRPAGRRSAFGRCVVRARLSGGVRRIRMPSMSRAPAAGSRRNS